MGKKSSKAPEIKESESEKALAQVSSQQWDRYKSIYRPVERTYIDEISKDNADVLRGRGTVDTAIAAQGSFGDAVALGNGRAGQLGETASNLGAARGLGAYDGNRIAYTQRDQDMLNALKIGNNMASDAQSGLAYAARAENTEALGRARAQSIKNEGRANALGSMAGVIGGAYIDKNREKWALQMDKPMFERT